MTDESEAGENVRPALTFTVELSVKVSDGRTDVLVLKMSFGLFFNLQRRNGRARERARERETSAGS